MKRLLLFAALLMAITGGAQSAQAAPFAFGPSAFDDSLTLKANLESIVTGNTGFIETTIKDGSALTSQYMMLMAVSQGAASSNFGIYEAGSGTMMTGASTVAADWGTGFFGDLGDYVVKFDGGPAQGISLANQLMIVLTYGDDIVYQPQGFDGYIVEGGSMILGFDINGDGGVDFVLGLSDVPFGQAPAVPVPAAVWLMGTGLAGIGALRRRINKAGR